MDLYGQAALAKHINDSKNIERNYNRVLKELEASNRRVEELEEKVAELTEENKKLKATKKKTTTRKKKATKTDTVAKDASEEIA